MSSMHCALHLAKRVRMKSPSQDFITHVPSVTNICIDYDGSEHIAATNGAGDGEADSSSPTSEGVEELPFAGLDVLVSELIANTPADTVADESSHMKSKGCITVHGVKLEVTIHAQQPRLGSIVEDGGKKSPDIGKKESPKRRTRLQ